MSSSLLNSKIRSNKYADAIGMPISIIYPPANSCALFLLSLGCDVTHSCAQSAHLKCNYSVRISALRLDSTASGLSLTLVSSRGRGRGAVAGTLRNCFFVACRVVNN